MAGGKSPNAKHISDKLSGSFAPSKRLALSVGGTTATLAERGCQEKEKTLVLLAASVTQTRALAKEPHGFFFGETPQQDSDVDVPCKTLETLL